MLFFSGFVGLIYFCRLCYTLAFGLYSSSFLKDLVCSPRPYTPPVTRLSKITAMLSLPSWADFSW
jgi:dihydrosphingosine 1-phosphate phosphatase